MVMPLYDIDPLEGKSTPYVTYGLIAINLLVSICVFFYPTQESIDSIINVFGLIPAIEARELPSKGVLPKDLTLFTSMFVHVSWWHVLSNMLFLWIFGDNIEDAMGHLRFGVFYFLCGFGGSVAFIISAPHSTVPLVGASGAIAGVMAAYLIIRPCATVEVFAFVRIFPIPAFGFIGVWIGLQIIHVEAHSQNGIAYWDHLGGAIAGALLIVALKQPHVRLLDCVWPSKTSISDLAGNSRGSEQSGPTIT